MGGGGVGTPPPYAHGVAPYFQLYGTGQFDGQSSGHDFMGTVFLPSTGELDFWLHAILSHITSVVSVLKFTLTVIAGGVS
jgi:hypothetical protein